MLLLKTSDIALAETQATLNPGWTRVQQESLKCVKGLPAAMCQAGLSLEYATATSLV